MFIYRRPVQEVDGIGDPLAARGPAKVFRDLKVVGKGVAGKGTDQQDQQPFPGREPLTKDPVWDPFRGDSVALANPFRERDGHVCVVSDATP